MGVGGVCRNTLQAACDMPYRCQCIRCASVQKPKAKCLMIEIATVKSH